MEESILKSVKKILGLSDSYTAFDLDIIMHINTVFSTLHQMGVGPTDGFTIEDDISEWPEFILTDTNSYNMVKTYVCLKVRSIFDPPSTSYVIEAVNKQIQELEWRISTTREWLIDPTDPMVTEEVV